MTHGSLTGRAVAMENCEFRINQQFSRHLLVFLAASLVFVWLVPWRHEQIRLVFASIILLASLGWSMFLVPRWSFLRIEDDGVVVSTPFWRWFVAFDSVERFQMVSTGQSLFYSDRPLEFVGYVAIAGSPLSRARWSRFCLRFHECHGVLPLVDGISAERLLMELNDRLARA